MYKLFTPTQVGFYKFSHRVVMAPLTRMRSDPGDIPSDLMVEPSRKQHGDTSSERWHLSYCDEITITTTVAGLL